MDTISFLYSNPLSMSQNLLDLVQNYFGGDTTRQVSTALGENESSIGAALRSGVPLVLGALFTRAQQPGGTADLLHLARQAHGSNLLGNLSSLLGGTAAAGTAAQAVDKDLLSRGTELLRSGLGLHYAPAVEEVSQAAGVRPATTSSLLSMAVPVVLGLLGRHAAQSNLDERGFSTYLNDQRGGVLSALSSLPGNLGNLFPGLGLGTTTLTDRVSPTAHPAADGPGTAISPTSPAAPGQAVGTSEPARRTPARWPWLLLLVLGLAALWYFTRSCNRNPQSTTLAVPDTTTTEPAPAPAPPAPTGQLDEATGNYIYEVGAPTELRLPDGTVLNVGANSVEVRLYQFLSDASQTVSADNTQGWLSLDRVYFDTGKATLTPESQAQLRNIMLILQAFPSATIKLGGYTDNVGPAEPNLLLSADRANAARKALLDNGLDPLRVQAEGYGQEHPVASNDTPEGRAQNRRVDVRVTRK
ncbi:OmpA family protein [Hymenobacter weizhouensis]|uniref:OmpA family protein n=1 Tax=Hymenobacter sp. YIM 151500-1 TaxID=2987689 RepID=UPI00222633AD|nr:OmpA family protein [Hymenobacter sp. YIM 151500-1]UYZ61641.1 OmpA family protein [Hymenobacter sp. YIM 151500-1]